MVRRAALLVMALAAAAGAASAQTVTGGRLAAPTADAFGIKAYKGIPYAAPPVGDLRWKPPAAVVAWTGERPTDRFGANCVQPKRYADLDPFTPGMSEDCLYLNVWSPAKPGEKLPVFFWIHGGGYGAGSGAEPRHDGVTLARKGVVVVTINYRLGPFGFFAHPELTAESASKASGNQALADMIAALKWVQANITALGGDPAKVTIAGESAGSDAVSRLMGSPQAKGLFRGVIGQSGSGFGLMGPDMPLAMAQARGQAFGRGFGSPDLASLRARSTTELLAMWTAPDTGMTFTPIADGWIIPTSTAQAFQAGEQNDVALLAGWTRDEGSLMEAGLYASGGGLPGVLKSRFGARAGEAARLYPSDTPERAARSRLDLASDIWMGFPTWQWMEAQTRTGKAPVYAYRFDHEPKTPPNWFGLANAGKSFGAFHSSDIPFAFGHPDKMPGWWVTSADTLLADQMSSYWANFVKAGDPNGPDLPAWPVYAPEGGAKKMILGPKTGAVPDEELARMKLMAGR